MHLFFLLFLVLLPYPLMGFILQAAGVHGGFYTSLILVGYKKSDSQHHCSIISTALLRSRALSTTATCEFCNYYGYYR